MGLYHSLKQAVPLEWKLGFYKLKPVPENLSVRVKNRLSGEPALPPGKLIYLIGAHTSPMFFLDSGRSATQVIRKVLNKNGLKIEQFRDVLDFGCGVGRIIRHWRTTPGPAWHGTDYNPDLIEWCRNHLKFADFRVNTLSGELPYEAESFDFIYAFSVFTHLSEQLQLFWLNELWRVLRPGGFLYFTTHGNHYLSLLNVSEREEFERGELVVREQQESGSNVCAVFHPAGYIEKIASPKFTVIDHVTPAAGEHSPHDVYLLAKK